MNKKSASKSNTRTTIKKSNVAKQQKTSTTSKETNIFSILSLVFGILFFIPLASILAIIFGFVSLNQIKNSNEDGKGMAIAGIILGFFWLLVWILLIMLFFMALTAAIMTAPLNP